MMADHWRRLILSCYLALTAAAMLYMGRPDHWDWFVLFVPFLLWALAPVALLCLLPFAQTSNGIGAAISAAVGALVYIDTAWIPPSDAQDGLIFIFLPIYQLAFALLWLALVALIRKFSPKEDT
ncbi:hypothetical protein [Aurantiacibacter hainanensis]|uniref:hypothetical protein n=1 Tax=Aurantiacibacter hainanensis TaxID=3076114 RepID=UPI0030C6CA3A